MNKEQLELTNNKIADNSTKSVIILNINGLIFPTKIAWFQTRLKRKELILRNL